jgi:hypothetical protein
MPSTITNLQALYPLCLPELKGMIPNGSGAVPLLDQYLSTTFRLFCRRTEAWREIIGPMNIVSGSNIYALPLIYDVWVRRIIWLRDSGWHSVPLSSHSYDLINTTSGSSVVLKQMPSANYSAALILEVVLMPYMYSQTLSPVFLEKWSEAIAAGAKANLMAMPDKAWSNPQMSAYYQSQFDRFVGEARFDNTHKNKSGITQIQYNQWAV